MAEPPTRHSRPDILISCAVHESIEWVEELTANALGFSAVTTRLILHLNAFNNYPADVIHRRVIST